MAENRSAEDRSVLRAGDDGPDLPSPSPVRPVRVARLGRVAAAALLVGGAGIAGAGAAPDGDGSTGDRLTTPSAAAAPSGAVLPSDAVPPSGAVPPSAAGPGTAEPRSGEPGPGGAQNAMYIEDTTRYVFSAEGLSDGERSAPVWALDTARVVSEAAATRFAAALGVEGPARLEYDTWHAGPADWSGPTLSIWAYGASLGFSDPTTDPLYCEPAPAGCPEIGPPPPGDVATAAARDVLASLDLDPAEFEVVAEVSIDPTRSWVTAHRLADGRPTGLVWSMSFTGAGLQSVHGSPAPLVPLGDYDVVSPVEAVERLGDPRFGGTRVDHRPAAGQVEPAFALASEDGSGVSGGDVRAGSTSRISWPVTEVTIVEARLVSAPQDQPGGAVLVVPTYELVSEDGGVWSVLAVDDAHLDGDPVGPGEPGGPGGPSPWPSYGYAERLVFRPSGLPGGAGSATAWTLDPDAVFTEETVARLAAALGVAGTPRLTDDGAWTVGSADWTGPAVWIRTDGAGWFSYQDPAAGTWYCPPAGTPKGEFAPDDPASTFAPGECAIRELGPPITGDAALAAARDALAALGLDLSGFELVEREHWDEGEDENLVTAHPLDSGGDRMPQMRVAFTGGGIYSIDGYLAPRRSLGEYDVVSPMEAVQRMGDNRFRPRGPSERFDVVELEPEGGWVVPGQPEEQPDVPDPQLPEPGSRISWPVRTVTIVEARLVTSWQYQDDRSVVLLPIYDLIDADGDVWSVLAIDEAELDLTPALRGPAGTG